MHSFVRLWGCRCLHQRYLIVTHRTQGTWRHWSCMGPNNRRKHGSHLYWQGISGHVSV